jgi:valyl-tRNA synthetase
MFGKTVKTPLFGVEVPVLAHHLAQKDKGSGIAMICTFGDVTDVIWWRELDLPNRAILGWDGRIVSEAPEVISDAKGKDIFAQLAGKTVFSAKQTIVELLQASGDMVGDPKPITHPVKFFEKGDKPLEIVSTRQWYIRNGGRDQVLREKLIELGKTLKFHPDFMRVRFENWVNGLTGDWLISRQRFFGVPIPVWYQLGADGNPDFEKVITPDLQSLPVDPSSQCPAGFSEDQRGKPNGFIGEVDIMDTWATSSLTPQLAGGWISDPEKYAKVFPFDLRPQGQDIIRTWLFSTVLRSFQEEGVLPWSDAALSGWILDPDRKKMSKSKGNVVVPNDLLDEHGSDAVRYWASSARLGTDAAFDVGQMKVGRRLAIKVLNAAKFVLSFEATSNAKEVTEPIDRAMLSALSDIVAQAGKAFESYDHTKALELTETFFWNFTDDYLELVKERAYGQDTSPEAQASAVLALRIALHTQLRLLAPFIPFATEEAWSWWQEGSIHRTTWPLASELEGFTQGQSASMLKTASDALMGVRKAKSDQQLSMKAEITSLTISASKEKLQELKQLESDLRSVGKIEKISFVAGDVLSISNVSFKPDN